MKQKIKNNWWLLLLLLLPALSGCNDTDDVQQIFVGSGKAWKLNYITTKNGHEMYNFWGNDAAARKESLDKLRNKDAYVIGFSGTTSDDVIRGTLSGTAIAAFKGNWSANAKSQAFDATVKGDAEKDLLAKNFIEGLNNADSYTGSDENNLYLYYKVGQQTLCLVFYLVK